MKTGDRVALRITAAMATWSFIILFLVLCLLEIWANHSGIMHFDPQTIILNLVLSLIAAIQGSIIMISQKQLDAKHDQTLQHIVNVVDLLEAQQKDKT